MPCKLVNLGMTQTDGYIEGTLQQSEAAAGLGSSSPPVGSLPSGFDERLNLSSGYDSRGLFLPTGI